MGSRYEEKLYDMLTNEPVTPSEMAKRLGVTYKTAQRALMHLALTIDDLNDAEGITCHIF